MGGGQVILVRAVKLSNERTNVYDEHMFYKIDIETQHSGTVSTCCPSLSSKIRNFDGRMVKLGGSSIVYIVGNKDAEEEEESIGSIACLKHGGWIDFGVKDPKWVSAPCPAYNTLNHLCVPLSGRIYSFGHSPFKLEVYSHDGGAGCWVELPPPPSEIRSSRVSLNPIADPENDRIIAHIDSAIYAFKPGSDDLWERLSPPDDDFMYWDMRSAIADGLLCIAHDGVIESIAAYDLADSALKLQVEWSNTYPDNIRGAEFHELLNLGNGFLCLAIYIPIYPITHQRPLLADRTRIYLAVFSFNRETRHLVTFTYHYDWYYDLFGAFSVIDYVPLGE